MINKILLSIDAKFQDYSYNKEKVLERIKALKILPTTQIILLSHLSIQTPIIGEKRIPGIVETANSHPIADVEPDS